jgi:copper homeostasis protein
MSMQVANSAELAILCQRAAQFASLGLGGLVAGFIKDDQIDLPALHAIAQAAPQMKITFHRAFDELSDPLNALSTLKTVPQVDRILTVGEASGHSNPWPLRKARLHHWQSCAVPEITILAGAGMLEEVIKDMLQDPQIHEVHIGRAARIPRAANGAVSRVEVTRIKGLA